MKYFDALWNNIFMQSKMLLAQNKSIEHEFNWKNTKEFYICACICYILSDRYSDVLFCILKILLNLKASFEKERNVYHLMKLDNS